MNLRDKDKCTLFCPKEMSRLRLPSYFDIYRHYSTLHKKKSTAIQETVKVISDIWNAASVPCYSDVSISLKLRRYFDAVHILKKKTSTNYFLKSYEHHEKLYNNKLFDVCTCHCADLKNCSCQGRKTRIPTAEHEFIIDQRTIRKKVLESWRTVPTSYQSRIRQSTASASSTTPEATTSSSTMLVTNLVIYLY